MNLDINTRWNEILHEHFETDKYKKLVSFIDSEYRDKVIYPDRKNIFKAFTTTPLDTISVVIIGQDPYHNPGQAHGLCFSVQDEITPPPSLKNIYKEIISDSNIEKNMKNGNLIPWAKQGVLLLNSVLTVEKNKPASHRKKGWEEFTDYTIQQISDKKEHCVFLLWGNYAKQKGVIIDRSKHLVLESAHPSPFSAYNGFFGNKHFSQTNSYLKNYHKKEINW